MIVCFKSDQRIVEMVLNKSPKIALVRDSYDRKYKKFSPHVLDAVDLHEVEDINNLEEICGLYFSMLSTGTNPRRAITGAEQGVLACGLYNSLIEGRWDDFKAAVLSRDKRGMKSVMMSAGVTCAKSMSFIKNQTLINEVATLSFPIVVKPTSGTGAEGAHVVSSIVEFSKLLDSNETSTATFLLEEFVKGEEYHVDTVWYAGSPAFHVVSKYLANVIQLKMSPTLNGSCVVPESITSKDIYSKSQCAMTKIVNAIGLTNGITHAEFFVDGNELVMSEFATRLAGGFIPQSIHSATGVDLVEYWIAAETATFAKRVKTDIGASGGWINLCPRKSGVILSLPDKHELLAHSWVKEVEVRKQLGDFFDAENANSWCIMITISSTDILDYRAKVNFLFENFAVQIGE